MHANPLPEASSNGHRIRHFTFFALSAALFAACLAFNGYYTAHSSANSGLLLMTGWLGLASWEVAWLANPILLFAAVAYARRRYRQAMKHSIVANGLMLSFLLTGKVMVSEAPTYADVTGYGLGYWLWLSSGATLLTGALVGQKAVLDAA